MKVSWFVTALLLLSAITMAGTVTTSGYVSPQTISFLPSLTFHPSFTFTFPTMTSSTHMFTFLPSITFTFSSTTSFMPTLPPATVLKRTDWAVLGVDALPLNPQVGDQMIFRMRFAALSSNVPFPQSVYVQCQIDGFSCGAGMVTYTGPVGSIRTVSASNYWPAIPGVHILTWFIDTTNDPNPGNNALSVQFIVQTPQAPTTIMPSIQTTQTQVIQPSTQPMTTVMQTSIQTVTQSPTQSSSSGLTSFSLQDYSLPLIAIIVLLVLALAFTMRKRKTEPTNNPQSNSWFCSRCGAANSINDNFCGKCGSAKSKS